MLTRALPLFLIVVAGCGGSPIDSVLFLPAPLEPRPPDHPIRIYRATVPECEFQEVGLVTWGPRGVSESLHEAAEAMRQRAREMGGDAILDFQFGRQNGGFRSRTRVSSDSTGTVTTSTGSVVQARIATGTVVRFEGGCSAARR